DRLERGEYLYYFGVIGVGIIIIILLYFSLRKKEQLQQRREQELEDNQYGTYASNPPEQDTSKK
ncbi:MAG: hypothetical protein SPL28_01310, partial [Bacteroidales bacterium]|nr:hypothetical protein [Bacteroidales bacterium]